MTAVDALGYLAAGLVLGTFCAKRMAPLRALAIASNIAFIAYGFLAALWPILLLHLVMLPMNCLRLREALGIRSEPKTRSRARRVALQAGSGDDPIHATVGSPALGRDEG